MNLEELLYVLPQLLWRLIPVGYLHQQKILCQNPEQQLKLEELLYVLPQLSWRLIPVGYLYQQKILCQNPKQQ
eukprot:12439103-Ditylum_brightwellii.AAC.1